MAAKKSGFHKKSVSFGKADVAPTRRAKASKKPADTESTIVTRTKKSVPHVKKPELQGEPAVASTFPLSELLQKAADMFVSAQSEKKLFFLLGYKKGMWQFEIVNCWQMWFEKSLQSEFRGITPESAVEAFLIYVAVRGINPAELTTAD